MDCALSMALGCHPEGSVSPVCFSYGFNARRGDHLQLAPCERRQLRTCPQIDKKRGSQWLPRWLLHASLVLRDLIDNGRRDARTVFSTLLELKHLVEVHIAVDLGRH